MDAVDNPDAVLAEVANQLADAVDDALPGWVERSVERLATAHGGPLTGDVRARARAAGAAAAAEVGPVLRALLQADVDEQAGNPLAVIRRAVRHPTEVLAGLGVSPVRRDPFEERAFPDDVYGLVPATWADVDPSLHEIGLLWGAAKAHVVLRRRRAEGRR